MGKTELKSSPDRLARLNFAKKAIGTGSALLISGLTLLFFLHLNSLIVSIQIQQLKNRLYAIDRHESGSDHITLVATFEIHKKLYEQRITQDEADRIEQKLHTLSLSQNDTRNPGEGFDDLPSKTALAMINFNRRVLGKAAAEISPLRESDYTEINSAYYLERNLLFRQAAETYEKALAMEGLSSTLRASILLRQAYCYSLCGENEKAQTIYSIIINRYSQESSAVTAAILDRYLKAFISARERTLHESSDALTKGNRLLSLLAYEQALQIISETGEGTSPAERARIEYIRGRCYSGIGEPQKAVEAYLKSISLDPAGEFAKYSNRKLYLIGSAAGPNNEITKMALELNETLKDPILSGVIRERRRDSPAAPAASSTPQLNITPELKTIAQRLKAGAEGESRPSAAIVRVHTSDGNVFRGKLIENSTTRVVLDTSIGRVTIEKNMITEMTE